MPFRNRSGVRLLEESEGNGPTSAKGDRIVFNWRVFLNQGDQVKINESQAAQVPDSMLRVVDGVSFVDHRLTLGRRDVIAGVEYALTGMRPGGYRKVRMSPHVAYRDEGLPGLIPANAVLTVELWLRDIDKQQS